jgi:hypothetical protein
MTDFVNLIALIVLDPHLRTPTLSYRIQTGDCEEGTSEPGKVFTAFVYTILQFNFLLPSRTTIGYWHP